MSGFKSPRLQRNTAVPGGMDGLCAKPRETDAAALKRERSQQEAILSIKKKFGKNAILKGMNLEEGATAKDRNAQIGGHKA